MQIPFRLIEHIRKGNIVLFLGWSDPDERTQGFLNERLLIEHFVKYINYNENQSSLKDIADYYEAEYGRESLIRLVCKIVEEHKNQFPVYYRKVINLPFTSIVSTTYDNSLNVLLRDAKRGFFKTVGFEEIKEIGGETLLLVKLLGDTENTSSLIITKEDYINFFDQLTNLSDLLKYYFSTKTLFFIGYDLNDPYFFRLYAFANQRTKGYHKRAYALKIHPTLFERRLWEKRNLILIDQSPEDCINEIAEAIPIDFNVSGYHPTDKILDQQIVEDDAILIKKPPYKFLNSYDEQDVIIFFGRDDDIERSIQKLLSSKLMILFGKSGIGKTSIISAGIIPRLIIGNYIPIYVRCKENPLLSIKTHTIDRLCEFSDIDSQKVANLSNFIHLPLTDFIRKIKTIDERPLIVFIDQFEEFFISLGSSTRRQFEKELAECVNSPSLSVTFLLSLREDFIPELNELKELPGIFENQYRLKALNIDQAKKAIVKPAYNYGITYEPGLVKTIIKELSGILEKQVDPAQLQIVCDQLFNNLPKDTKVVTYSLYDSLGGVKQILADYVKVILDSFGSKRRSVAEILLQSMVTSYFTRIALRLPDAVLVTKDIPDWSTSKTRDLLKDLVRVRLIRRIADLEEEAYELTHEYLINEIREWIDLETVKIKEAQDLLRQAFNNWQRHKINMDKYALEIIDSQRENIILNDKLLAFVLVATVFYDYEFQYWVKRNLGNQAAVDNLLWILREESASAKRTAGIALGTISNDEKTVEEVISTFFEVANPNTIKRIEYLQSKDIIFTPNLLEEVREIVVQRFKKNMSFVKSEEFFFGFSEEQIEEILKKYNPPQQLFESQNRQRKERLGDYWIDKFLVTNQEFKEFNTKHEIKAGQENYPVTDISWYEANAYAEWLGKVLPSELQWEKAARGTDGRLFPWGKNWDPTRCNTRASGKGGITPVNQYPNGISPYGCFDMAGNVWEWTADWANADQNDKVVKGGSWSRLGVLPWTAYKFDYEPDSSYGNVGFRCVKVI